MALQDSANYDCNTQRETDARANATKESRIPDKSLLKRLTICVFDSRTKQYVQQCIDVYNER